MVALYENAIRLQRLRACDVTASILRRRSPGFLQAMYSTRVVPDAVYSLSVSRTLIPIIRKLRWSLQRDKFSRMLRDTSGIGQGGGVAAWIQAQGPSMIQEGERMRLAICPNVKKIIRYWEGLAN